MASSLSAPLVPLLVLVSISAVAGLAVAHCGNKCTGGTICNKGVCKCPTGQCWTGTICSKVVGTFATDPNNCGVCGNQCPAGAACCSCNSPGSCTDISTNSNCGKCGNQCPVGSTCVNGACGCATQCTGDTTCVKGACKCATAGTCLCGANKCVNKLTDVLNCGACGKKCPSGSTCCEGSCADTTSDRKNCGVCGNQCSLVSICCNGSCTDTTSDGSNCGVCGKQCSEGSICSNSSCVDATNVCGNQSCAPGSTCCEGSCTGDTSNCGVCGQQCMGRTGSDCHGDVQCMSCVKGGCSLYVPASYGNYDWSTFFELFEGRGVGYIQFTAEADSDVHVALSSEAATTTPWYEIVIGANQSSYSHIVHVDDSGLYQGDYQAVSLDNPGGLNDLWVSFDRTKHVIEAGKGIVGNNNSETILSFQDPNFLPQMRFFGFSSGTRPNTYTNMVVGTILLE